MFANASAPGQPRPPPPSARGLPGRALPGVHWGAGREEPRQRGRRVRVPLFLGTHGAWRGWDRTSPRGPGRLGRLEGPPPRPASVHLGDRGTLCHCPRSGCCQPPAPRLTWLLRPIWKPERAHRNHDAEQMRDPRKHGGPATHGPATEGCGMFQNRPPHSGSSSVRIQKTLSKLGDLKSSWAAPQPLLSTWVQVIRPERIEVAPSLLVLNPVGGRAAEAGGDGASAGLPGDRCARSPRGQQGRPRPRPQLWLSGAPKPVCRTGRGGHV